MRAPGRLALLSLGLWMMGAVAPGCGDGTTVGTDAAVPRDAASPVDAASPDDAASEDDAATPTDAAVTVDAAADLDAGPPRSCGGRGGGTCLPNELCSYTIDDICGRADAMGTCAPRPDACTTGTLQVCGCDGVTYDTECFANAAGTSVDHRGACE